MHRREFLIGAAVAAVGEFLVLPMASAQSDHIAMAIAQINKAIPFGEEPAHSASFVQHVDNAIDHAVMAQRQKKDTHVRRAIAYLRRARRTASGTHMLSYSRRAASMAKRALAQLEAVK